MIGMAKVNKAEVDKNLRERVFQMIADGDCDLFQKVNDRQQGIILTDLNGESRYIRLGAIVAELRDDMTAEELEKALMLMYTISGAYLTNRIKIVEYERDKLRQI